MTETIAETVRKRTRLVIVLVGLLALSGCLSISTRDDDDDGGYNRHHNGHYYYDED